MLRVLIVLLMLASPLWAAERWNGTSWETVPAKRYNGSAWVDTTQYRYNGSSWVNITPSGGDYSDITFYANADTLGITPQKGTGTMTFSGGILLHTATPILGAGSWDNNNDGYDAITIPASGNLDWDDARVFVLWRPYENSNGDIIRATDSNTDFAVSYYNATQFKFRYKDQVAFVTHGLATFDGSVTYGVEVAMTGTTATLYVDGVQKAQVTSATGTISNNLFLGAAGANQWDAHYDQIIISNDTSRDLYSLRNTTSF